MKEREEKKKNKEERKESELVTKESLCAVCALFSLLALLVLFTRALVFGEIGLAIHSFLTGVFGYAAYPVLLGALYLSVTGLIGKRFVKNRRAGCSIAAAAVCVLLLIHTAVTFSWQSGGYLNKCFRAGEAFPAATPAGWLGGLFACLCFSLMSKVGAIVVFSLLTVFFGYLTYLFVKKPTLHKEKTAQPPQPQNIPVEIPVTQPVSVAPQPPQTEYAPPKQETEFNGYAINAPQRPAFSLPQEENVGGGNGFSPFNAPDSVPVSQESEYGDSRAFLFGNANPAENFRRNLIFDPNSRANQRDANPPQTPVVSRESYSSYTDAYQNTVNAETTRPTKILSDYTQDYAKNYDGEEKVEALETEYPTPMQPIEETPVLPQEPVSYPTFTPDPVALDEPSTREDESPRRHDYMNLFSPSNPNIFGSGDEENRFAQDTFSSRENEYSSRGRDDDLFASERDREEKPFEETHRAEDPDEISGRRGIDLFDDDDDDEKDDPYTLRSDFGNRNETSFADRSIETDSRSAEAEILSDRGRDSFVEEPRVVETVKPVEVVKPTPPPPPPKPRVIKPYKRVPLDDFDCRDVEPTSNEEEVEETKSNIIATLDEFKVNGASIASVTFGPTVSRYNVTVPRGISPKKVVALDQSIAINLHSSGVNIYPNYEDGVVSIEVPNKERQFVQLGCMLSGDTFLNAKSSSLMFAMGKDAGNRKVYGDISKMIHLLVAGSSGSGKSVFLGALIISLIYKYSPEELRLILVDPKKTEFVLYNNLPHLMINEIITDVNKTIQSLNWAIGEMNRRYGLFEQMSRKGTYVVNLDQYNAQLEKSERLPKIVIIIDELADLMLAAKKDIEDRIQNLTQKARAAGIHLVVATQRPSTDVITGVIKSNLPTRIAFAVATDVDSRVILDQTGAQKLLGMGDFLYTMQGINTPVRVQSAFISSEDSQRVVNFIKANNEAYYDENATAYINNVRGTGENGGDSFGGSDEVEPVYIEALRYVILNESASISMIQRKCSVGYNKAGKIVEWMEDMGYISSFDGAKARKVLITKEEFESKYGSL